MEEKQVRVIIPAAGFGTRVSCAVDESKEMLPDPVNGRPLIAYSLDICFDLGINPIVITRPEKRDLISYISELESSIW